MMDCPNKARKMWNISTLHRRWDLCRHPLYKVKYNSLIDLMTVDIEGMPDDYTPDQLLGTPDELLQGSSADSPTDTPTIVKRKITPPSAGLRYSDIRALTGPIEEHGKESKAVYNMLIKPLQQLRLNCLILTGKAAKSIGAKGVSIPTVPASLVKENTMRDKVPGCFVTREVNPKR